MPRAAMIDFHIGEGEAPAEPVSRAARAGGSPLPILEMSPPMPAEGIAVLWRTGERK